MNVVLQGRTADGAAGGRWHNRRVATIPDGEQFEQAWNGLPRRDRLRVRRLVRMGRPVQGPEEATVAVAYARFQRSRIWARLFWVWFVPGLIVALAVASQIHPVLEGVVLALAAQAVFAHFNLGRVERVNADLLGT